MAFFAFFAFFASFCILLTPRAMDGQLSLDSPRSAIAPRSMPPSLIRLCTIQLSCSFFLFLSGNALFGQFGPKNQNYQFKLKFGTYTNSNMQNSMVMFILSVFDWKYPFWANLVQKVKIIS